MRYVVAGRAAPSDGAEAGGGRFLPAAVMAHFPRQLQHFASFGKSRYEWTRRSGAPSDHPFATGSRTVVYDPFVDNSVFVT